MSGQPTAYEIKEESSEALAQFPTNRYHKDRLAAAEAMIDAGLGEATYGTHYNSGTTYWASPGSEVWDIKVVKTKNGSEIVR